jgi:hypothetical protein
MNFVFIQKQISLSYPILLLAWTLLAKAGIRLVILSYWIELTVNWIIYTFDIKSELFYPIIIEYDDKSWARFCQGSSKK